MAMASRGLGRHAGQYITPPEPREQGVPNKETADSGARQSQRVKIPGEFGVSEQPQHNRFPRRRQLPRFATRFGVLRGGQDCFTDGGYLTRPAIRIHVSHAPLDGPVGYQGGS